MSNRAETIGDCTLILGDCLEVMQDMVPTDGRSTKPFNHVISDPPYEEFMHAAKQPASRRALRTDGGNELKGLDFEGIDSIRENVVNLSPKICSGWSIYFCSPEGVGKWAGAINASPAKYKRSCVWVKPDSTPQLNGQGPAMGAENFVVAWCGKSYAKWNAGGKRGVYTHNTNSRDRHGEHPTEKPWRLIVEILNDFTNSGQAILDPFMGSGTTGVACIKTGRKFTGIELNERYFDIACERIRKAYDQPDMFVAPPKPLIQNELFTKVAE